MPAYGTGFGIYKDASGGGGAPPVGTGGIYGGNGTVPTSVTATLTDTLTFASGDVVMGTSANLLIGANFLKFNTFEVYDDSGILTFEDTAGGQEFNFSADGGNSEYQMTADAFICSGNGEVNIDISTSDALISYLNANGSAFQGDLGSLALTADRTWRLPDTSGTLALLSNTLYNGDGTILTGRVATITDTLTFTGGKTILRGEALASNTVLDVKNGQYGSTILEVVDNHTTSVTTIGTIKVQAVIQSYLSAQQYFNIGYYGTSGSLYGDSDQNSVWVNNRGNINDGQGTSVIVVSSSFYIDSQTLTVFKIDYLGNLSLGDEKVVHTERLFVKGSGSTSATTTCLLQNSSGTDLFTVLDDGGVGIGGTPDGSAILDLQSTSKGFLPPRMTTLEKASILLPETGLIVYDTDLSQWMGNNGTTGTPIWVILG